MSRTTQSPSRRVGVITTVTVAALVLGACDDGSDDADGTTEAWCRQSETATISLAAAVDLDPNDPANTEQILAAEAELDALTELEIPEAIQEDWERSVAAAGGPLPVEDPDADAARRRVAEWTLEECDPSPAYEAILREELER